MNKNVLFIYGTVGVIALSILSIFERTGTNNILLIPVFSQTSINTTTTIMNMSSSPIDSFINPQGYAIAKKHVYDAPLLDVHFYCSNTAGGIMATCLLFDGNSTNSTLIGIEYVISSEQYASLLEREKPNWSPLAEEEEEAEVRYPNLTPQQLQELSEQFKDAYVKLIITWNPNDDLPLYPPQVVIESLIDKNEHE